MKFLKLAILLLLATIVLACESTEDKADEETYNSYTGNDNTLSRYIAYETDENGNPINEENNEPSILADYHREDGKHTDFRVINKYEEVVNDGFGGSTIVARAIIKEDVFSTASYINKLTITLLDEDEDDTYEAKFTPNQELFPNSKTLTAKSGETLTFDFGDVRTDSHDTGGSFGLLELYSTSKHNGAYSYDYFTVLNQ